MKQPVFSRILTASVLTLGIFVLSHSPSMANEAEQLKEQVQALQQKVNQLEQQLAERNEPASRATPNHKHSPVIYGDEWDPWGQMEMMQRQMNQLMSQSAVDFNPREDIKETANEYIISLDIPGMDKDKINIEVKGGRLVISGERHSEVKEDKPHQYYRQERSFGNFVRSLALPDNVRTDQIDAQYNNGVLTVKLPKKQANLPQGQAQKIKVK